MVDGIERKFLPNSWPTAAVTVVETLAVTIIVVKLLKAGWESLTESREFWGHLPWAKRPGFSGTFCPHQARRVQSSTAVLPLTISPATKSIYIPSYPMAIPSRGRSDGQVYIRLLTGSYLCIDAGDTNQSMYRAVSLKLGLSESRIRLIYRGEVIPQNETSIQAQAKIICLIRQFNPETFELLDKMVASAGICESEGVEFIEASVTNALQRVLRGKTSALTLSDLEQYGKCLETIMKGIDSLNEIEELEKKQIKLHCDRLLIDIEHLSNDAKFTAIKYARKQIELLCTAKTSFENNRDIEIGIGGTEPFLSDKRFLIGCSRYMDAHFRYHPDNSEILFESLPSCLAVYFRTGIMDLRTLTIQEIFDTYAASNYLEIPYVLGLSMKELLARGAGSWPKDAKAYFIFPTYFVEALLAEKLITRDIAEQFYLHHDSETKD